MIQNHRFKIGKLVRNKLPNILRIAGIKLNINILNSEEYAHHLKNKLVKEALEIL